MNDTKTKIMDLAECLTQQKGFNGFSYLDIAEEIGIKAASIHYHYKCKDDLAIAIVERTHKSHMEGFQNLEVEYNTPEERLLQLIVYFQGYVAEQKFCLCGMMAAELHSVSAKVKSRLENYFTEFQEWLANQFKQMGHTNASLRALQFLSALEGSLLLARLRQEPNIIQEALAEFT